MSGPAYLAGDPGGMAEAMRVASRYNRGWIGSWLDPVATFRPRRARIA
jgi:hypothetical protein